MSLENAYRSVMAKQEAWAREEILRTMPPKEKQQREFISALLRVIARDLPDGDEREVVKEFIEANDEYRADYASLVTLFSELTYLEDLGRNIKILCAGVVIQIKRLDKSTRSSYR